MSLDATEGNPRIEKLISNSLVARVNYSAWLRHCESGDLAEQTKPRADVENRKGILADDSPRSGSYRGFAELGPKRYDFWSTVLFAAHSGRQVGI